MSYFLGVDGGNTKTIALVAYEDGTIIGAGRSGCSDIYGAPTPQAAMEQLSLAVLTALEHSQQQRESIVAGCFSLAGADWPEDYEFLENQITQAGYGQKVLVYNDAIGALRAGSPDGTGVVIAAGTGIATAARNAAGEFWHTSFWQEASGGGEFGNQVLRAICRAELGIDPPTSLTQRMLEFYKAASVEEILHRRWSRFTPTDVDLTKAAPILLDEATNGDAVARRIVEAHGSRLGDYALAVARKVGIQDEPFTLVLNGGIFRHRGKVLIDSILARVRATSPHIQPVFSRYEPALGALFLAFEAGGIRVDHALLARIEATMPGFSLFQT